MPRARDLMEAHVMKVGPETPIPAVYRLFLEAQISAAPVVDELEQVVGVVTTSDLVRALDEERDTTRVAPDYLRTELLFSAPDRGDMPQDLQDRLGQLRVSDIMTEGVVSVTPDTTAGEVAETLRKNRLHHVFVIEDEELRGVVSTFDLLGLIT